jgi:tetratricopeptide (TPR) repeat protein
MESAGRKTLWYLLRANSDEAQRMRRRLAVGTALALLFAGLLAAARLEIVVFASAVLVVVLVSGRAAVRALQRNGRPLKTSGRGVGAAFWHGCLRVTGAARTLPRHFLRLTARLSPHARSAVAVSAARAARVRTSVAGSVRPILARALTRGVEYLRHAGPAPRARQIDLQREALRLNAAGTRQRRSGSHAKAIALHSRALEILGEVDDRRAVALTQNNLALALSHVGDHDRATRLLEQAAATLHQLGDQEHEGRIMANLALAHRRDGRPDECVDVLQLALTKLRRDTRAYKLVEAELSRVT